MSVTRHLPPGSPYSISLSNKALGDMALPPRQSAEMD